MAVLELARDEPNRDAGKGPHSHRCHRSGGLVPDHDHPGGNRASKVVWASGLEGIDDAADQADRYRPSGRGAIRVERGVGVLETGEHRAS